MQALELFYELTKTETVTQSLIAAVNARQGAAYVAALGLHYPLKNRGFWGFLNSVEEAALFPLATHLCNQLEVTGHCDLVTKCPSFYGYLRRRKVLKDVMRGFSSVNAPQICQTQSEFVSRILRDTWTTPREQQRKHSAYFNICLERGFSIEDIKEALYIRGLELWEQGVYRAKRRPARRRRMMRKRPQATLLQIVANDTSLSNNITSSIRWQLKMALGSGRVDGESSRVVYRAVRAAVRNQSFQVMRQGFQGRPLQFWKLVVQHLQVKTPGELEGRYPSLHELLSSLTHKINGCPMLTLYAVFE